MMRPLHLALHLPLAALATLLPSCDLPNLSATDAAGAPAASSAPAASAAPTVTPTPLALPNVDASAYAAATETQAIGQRLAGSILVGGHAMDYLRDLADGIGPRLTGSESHRRAAAWGAECFRKAGIERVAVEPFTIPHGWERGTATMSVVAPVERSVRAAAYRWGPPTPKEGILGDLVYLKDASPE